MIQKIKNSMKKIAKKVVEDISDDVKAEAEQTIKNYEEYKNYKVVDNAEDILKEMILDWGECDSLFITCKNRKLDFNFHYNRNSTAGIVETGSDYYYNIISFKESNGSDEDYIQELIHYGYIIKK